MDFASFQPTVCVKSQMWCQAPPVELFSAVLSCTDISGYNMHQSEFGNCVETGKGATGGTLHGALGYIGKWLPPLMVLANVIKLGFKTARAAPCTSGVFDHTSPKIRLNLRSVVKALEDKGYDVICTAVDPSEYYIP